MEVGREESLFPCTTATQHVTIDFARRDGSVQRIALVDTPGLNQPVKSDGKVFQEIITYLRKRCRQGISRGGVIYLHDLSDCRWRNNMHNELRLLNSAFREHGGKVRQRICLATTKWEDQRIEKGNRSAQQRHDELARQTRWESLVLQCCNSSLYPARCEEDARKIVDDLLDQIAPPQAAFPVDKELDTALAKFRRINGNIWAQWWATLSEKAKQVFASLVQSAALFGKMS
ncbi:TKL/TKL-ccin protein kinase [Coprinopsis cinerea AmutBmut pab1-1]|nr:TKL/TKL-ccin protein kinase [Coprinopsis cinerea AmutBmut pab1-1]